LKEIRDIGGKRRAGLAPGGNFGVLGRKNRSNDDSVKSLRPHFQVDERQLMQPARPEPLLSPDDYNAIEAAVMETARGRWFLAEYARRNRHADTEAVLGAIRRLERLVHSAGSFHAQDEVARGMAEIAQAIVAAQATSPSTLEAAEPVERQAGMVDEHFISEEGVHGETEDNTLDAFTIGSAELVEKHLPPGEPGPASALSQVRPQEEPVAAVELAVETIPASDDVSEMSEWEKLETIEPAPEPIQGPAEAVTGGSAAERDIIDELETFLAETTREAHARQVAPEAPASLPKMEARAEKTAEAFPIIELDDEAAEALLTQDPPRQELILPTNHVATQRWSKDFVHEVVETPELGKPETDEPLRTSLVTFVDEEPADESGSVFSAPLRLEPEGAENSGPELTSVAAPIQRHSPPPVTMSEIEAMPFARKAILFS
jgi:hypothetical protein